jgi:hypothetical protein
VSNLPSTAITEELRTLIMVSLQIPQDISFCLFVLTGYRTLLLAIHDMTSSFGSDVSENMTAMIQSFQLTTSGIYIIISSQHLHSGHSECSLIIVVKSLKSLRSGS